MRLIPLTHGQFAKWDDADYERLMLWRWSAVWKPSTKSFVVHRRGKGSDGKYHTIYMHRCVLGLSTGDGIHCDHRNLDTLDNQKENLRRATPSENMCNRGRQVNNTSGFKGVSRFDKKWKAAISINKRKIYLGLFSTAEEAANAYASVADGYHGEFARV